MPMTSRRGQAKRSELPSTLRRSSRKAQDTFAKTHDNAVKEYGEGARAHQTAYSSLKHSYEKVGDHWEPKKKKGPSDAQSERGGAGSRRTYHSGGGVDEKSSKAHLYQVARRLDIPGRSQMDKRGLISAIKKANDRASRRARSSP
jgi:cation transport regulator ChaB